jgi:NADH-quinone oxidoreductase subunit E
MNLKKIDAIMKKWRHDPEYVIEMLQDVQDDYRHLPEAALKHMADSLDVPLNRLYHIGTFFSSFSLEAKGKHIVQVCMGTACHVKGAPKVLDALARELDVKPGETTKDKLFTLEAVRCLGCCSLAPVVAIDDKLFGGVTPSQVPKLIKQTRKGKGVN